MSARILSGKEVAVKLRPEVADALFTEHAAGEETIEAGYVVEIFTTSRQEI